MSGFDILHTCLLKCLGIDSCFLGHRVICMTHILGGVLPLAMKIKVATYTCYLTLFIPWYSTFYCQHHLSLSLSLSLKKNKWLNINVSIWHLQAMFCSRFNWLEEQCISWLTNCWNPRFSLSIICWEHCAETLLQNFYEHKCRSCFVKKKYKYIAFLQCVVRILGFACYGW